MGFYLWKAFLKLFSQKDSVSYDQLTIHRVQKIFISQLHKFVASICVMETRYRGKFVLQKKMSVTTDYYM
ncbi:hypothetical protein A7P25_24930 [Achromobacter xylosoxidans]|nr:hypothetical protein A7P25_24930 [Achromobacter xylosoxidans]